MRQRRRGGGGGRQRDLWTRRLRITREIKFVSHEMEIDRENEAVEKFIISIGQSWKPSTGGTREGELLAGTSGKVLGAEGG